MKKKGKKTGQGWPVSPGTRKGPGSGSIFPTHIKTGLFSPTLKSPWTGRVGPPVLTALDIGYFHSLGCEFKSHGRYDQGFKNGALPQERPLLNGIGSNCYRFCVFSC